MTLLNNILIYSYNLRNSNTNDIYSHITFNKHQYHHKSIFHKKKGDFFGYHNGIFGFFFNNSL